MNKEWFIFKGTHHLGPFSLEEMEEFFTVGEITGQSLVWREGKEKWEALSKTPELTFLVNPKDKTPAPVGTVKVPAQKKPANALSDLPADLPADLPDLPDDDLPPPMPPGFLQPQHDGPAAHKKSAPETVSLFDDEPPPIPLDALLNPLGKRPEFKKKDEGFFAKNPRLIFGTLVALFAVVVVWFAMNEHSSSVQIRIKGVMPVYLDKLTEIAQQRTPSMVIGMALSLDGKTIYASTNKDGEILSIIRMKSLPKRILGTNEVELMVRGVIRDRLGEFSRMQLTKGPQFVPGEYNVEFNGRRLFFLNRHFKFLNGISFFKKLNTNYSFHTTTLIYAGTPREFEKKLAEYQESITNEQLKPFNDKLERLQTFGSLLNKTVEDYLLVLEKISKPKDISGFEKTYMKEVSPIVQSLVVAANEMAKTKEGQENDTRYRVASYASQIQLGKQIGELASDMITETEKLKKITDSDKTKMKARYEARYKNIKSQIDSHITKVQAEIAKISN